MISSDDNPNLSQELPKDNPNFHCPMLKGLVIPILSKGFPKSTGIIYEQLFCVNSGAVQHFFEAAPELLHGLDRDLVAYAWEGALFNVLRPALADAVNANADELSTFLIRWNMRALGLSEETIEQALTEVKGDPV